MYAVPAPPVRLVRFSPDHFWLCPIPFVLEYPNQRTTFPCMADSTGPLQIWWRRPCYILISYTNQRRSKGTGPGGPKTPLLINSDEKLLYHRQVARGLPTIFKRASPNQNFLSLGACAIKKYINQKSNVHCTKRTLYRHIQF